MLRRGVLRTTLAIVCLGALALGAAGAAAQHRADDGDDDAPPPAAANPQASAGGYQIKLTRPTKPGQRFLWVADATVVDSASGVVSGQTRSAAPESVSVHLEGVVTIVEVNADGECTTMVCAVNECVARSGRERRTVVAPGKVITAEAGKWKTKLTPESGTLTIEEDILLRTVLSLPKLDDVSDDEAFGTTKKVKVGETWPVRPDEIVKLWAAAGYKIKKQNVSGTMKLKSVETVDGVECVRVTGRARIEHFLPPGLDLPHGIKVDDATVELKFTKLMPVDPGKPLLLDSHSTTVHTVVKPDGKAITPDLRIEGKVLRTVGVKLRQLPD